MEVIHKSLSMKSIRNYTFYTVLALALVLSACQEDLLDKSPVTTISNESAYSTPAKVLAQGERFVRTVQQPVVLRGPVYCF